MSAQSRQDAAPTVYLLAPQERHLAAIFYIIAMNLHWPVAANSDSPAHSLFRPVIPDRIVHTATVVPESHDVQRPSKAYLEIYFFRVIE